MEPNTSCPDRSNGPNLKHTTLRPHVSTCAGACTHHHHHHHHQPRKTWQLMAIARALGSLCNTVTTLESPGVFLFSKVKTTWLQATRSALYCRTRCWGEAHSPPSRTGGRPYVCSRYIFQSSGALQVQRCSPSGPRSIVEKGSGVRQPDRSRTQGAKCPLCPTVSDSGMCTR